MTDDRAVGTPVPSRPAGASLFRPLPEGGLERRIVDAYDACLDRWGEPKTTMADVAREAGVSRATVYRVVPGGKATLAEMHRRHSLASFFADLDALVPTDAPLPELLTSLLGSGTQLLADDVAFQRRLADDPGAVLPELTFRGLDRIFAAARVFFGPRGGG
ncbi:MAG: TetR family transcriptional regulator, partial [Actinomycetota bacterium]